MVVVVVVAVVVAAAVVVVVPPAVVVIVYQKPNILIMQGNMCGVTRTLGPSEATQGKG